MAIKFYEGGECSTMIHFFGKRKLYIVFIDNKRNLASAYVEIEGDITISTVNELHAKAAETVGLKPDEVIILNWKILEG